MWTRSKALYLVILISACLLPRIVGWANLDVIPSLDSPSYIQLAERIAGLDFRDYDGARTPVYPFLIACCGMNLDRVWHVQSLMGVLTALMLYHMVHTRTQRRGLSLAAMLLYAWNIVPLIFETMILTEALAGLLVTLTFWLLCRGKKSVAHYSLVGFTAALAGLTRPPMLSSLLALGVYFLGVHLAKGAKRDEESGEKLIVRAVALCTAFLLPVLGWCAFNWTVTGSFGPTTLNGYNLTNLTGGFIELAPDRYAVIKSVYVQCRNERLSHGGPVRGTIFECIEEMQLATGLSFPDLSRELSRMSLWLLLHHPIRYLQAAGMNWLRFWNGPPRGYWDMGTIQHPFWRALAHAGWVVSSLLVYAASCLFLLATLLLLLRPTALTTSPAILMSVICAVFTASIVGAVMEYGRARYAVPYYPLILFVVLVSWQEWVNRAASKQRRPEDGRLPMEGSKDNLDNHCVAGSVRVE